MIKQLDTDSGQRSLLFQINYPEISKDIIPKLRFMSSFEQRVEPVDKAYQYILVAAAPYNTIAFKIPNLLVDRSAGKYLVHWDSNKKIYTVQVHFLRPKTNSMLEDVKAN